MEGEFIFVFVEGGLDFKVLIDDKFIVLGVVCEYRNINFIKYLL